MRSLYDLISSASKQLTRRPRSGHRDRAVFAKRQRRLLLEHLEDRRPLAVCEVGGIVGNRELLLVAAPPAEGNSDVSRYAFRATNPFLLPWGFTFGVSGAGAAPAEADDFASPLTGSVVVPILGSSDFFVDVVGDTDIEPDEGFSVSIGSACSVGATIVNDDVASVAIGDTTITEGGDLQFTVTFSGATVPGGFTVDFATADGTAIEADGDYTAASGTLTFDGTDGETQTITVSTTADEVVEPDETLTVALSNLSVATVTLGTSTGTGTITDNSEASVAISPATVTEGGILEFTVTLTGEVEGGFTLDFATSDGTATLDDSDYEETTGTLEFEGNDGETQTIRVQTTQDTNLESAETLDVTLSNPSIESVELATDTAEGTIENDDVVQIEISDAEVLEGGQLAFTVTLGGAVDGGVSVEYESSDDTATVADSDYTPDSGLLAFTGTEGETQQIIIQTTDDGNLEADEVLKITIKNIYVGTSTTPSTDTRVIGSPARGTIIADDSVSFSISDAMVSEGGDLQFFVTLAGTARDGITVDWAAAADTAELTDFDFPPSFGTLSFQGVDGEVQIAKVSTTADTKVEADELLTVTLSNPQAGEPPVPADLMEVPADPVTGTILNDDQATFTIENAIVVEGGALSFAVSLSNAVQGGVTMAYTLVDDTAKTSDNDYTNSPAPLSFDGVEGELITIIVPTTGDTKVEIDEVMKVLPGSVTPGGAGVDPLDFSFVNPFSTGTILNDDYAELLVSAATATEGGALSFVITLTNAVQDGLTVQYGTQNGTASALDGDFVAASGTLVFGGTTGETKTVSVSTTNDSKIEGNETLSLRLNNIRLRIPNIPYGSFITTPAVGGLGTIVDDDSADITVTDVSATEGGVLQFTVRLGAAVQGGVLIDYLTTDGSATLGNSDYGYTAGTVQFQGTAGEIKIIAVPSLADTSLEANETVNLLLSNARPADPNLNANSLTISKPVGVGTILNDDTSSVSINDVTVSEGGSLVFEVRLGNAVQGGATVSFQTADGTAVAPDDYSSSSGSVVFTGAAGEVQFVTIPTTPDVIVEANETMRVTITSPLTLDPNIAAGRFLITRSQATGSIQDDDVASLAISDASIAEGGNLQFTVTLTGGVSGGFQVEYVTSDGTARTSDLDYSFARNSVAFIGTPGETKTVTIPTTQDAKVEADETLFVTLQNVRPTLTTVSSTKVGLPASPAMGTIVNEDVTTLVVSNPSILEGGILEYSVTSSNAVLGGFVVDIATSDGTATTLDSDYTATGMSILFTGNANESRTFRVFTTADGKVERGETVLATLSNAVPTNTAISTGVFVLPASPATGTILNDDKAQLSVANVTVVEGNVATFTATLNNVVDGGFTVSYNAADGTAKLADADFAAASGTLAFAGTSGESHTFSVATNDDPIVEANETFQTLLSNVVPTLVGLSPADIQTPAAAPTGTISNDDSTTLAIADVSAFEGSPLTFTVNLSNPVQGGFTVAYATSDGTATSADNDYTAASGTLTFAGNPGETKTITVATTPDTKSEYDETLRMTLSNVTPSVSGVPAANVVVTGSPATGTIVTNGADVSVAVLPTSVNEDGTANLVYRFTRTGTIASALVANFSVAGTATFATDYVTSGATSFTATAGTVTFPANAATVDVIVDPVADATAEANETVVLTVTAGSGYAAASPTAATGTIANDDPQVSVTLSPASIVEDTRGQFVYTFTRSGPTTSSLTAGFSVAGTASLYVDYTTSGAASYTGTNGTVLFPAGVSNVAVRLTVTADTTVENDETITLTVSPGTTYFVNEAQRSATATIVNDDAGVSVAVANSPVPEDSGQSLVYTFTRTGALAAGLTARFNVSGSATLNTDYTVTGAATYTTTSGTVNFAPGAATAIVQLTPVADATIESNETVSLSVVASTGYTAVAPTLATGTIANDDPKISVWAAPATIAEDGSSQITYNFSRTGPTTSYLTVYFAVGGTATYNTDYTQTGAFSYGPTSGSVRFVLNASVAQVVIRSKADTIVEPNETIVLSVTPNASYFTTAPVSVTTTIIDDDGGAGGEGEQATTFDELMGELALATLSSSRSSLASTANVVASRPTSLTFDADRPTTNARSLADFALSNDDTCVADADAARFVTRPERSADRSTGELRAIDEVFGMLD